MSSPHESPLYDINGPVPTDPVEREHLLEEIQGVSWPVPYDREMYKAIRPLIHSSLREAAIEGTLVRMGYDATVLNEAKEESDQRATDAEAALSLKDQTIIMQGEEIDRLGKDAVTGLMTRGMWESQAKNLLTKSGRYTLLLGDLDLFKRVNDTYGHSAGDKTLGATGGAAKATLHDPELPAAILDDIVIGRYGGEEIVALIPERKGDPDYAFKLAQSFIAETNKIKYPSTFLKGQRIPESIQGLSIGLLSFKSDGKSTAARLRLAVKYADAALYDAKHNGRNQVRKFEWGVTPIHSSREDRQPKGQAV